MKNTKVVVTVEGGFVQSVIADSFVEVVIVDWDSIDQGDPGPRELEFVDGTNVSDFMCSPRSIRVFTDFNPN